MSAFCTFETCRRAPRKPAFLGISEVLLRAIRTELDPKAILAATRGHPRYDIREEADYQFHEMEERCGA
jgi:hypothetical protein